MAYIGVNDKARSVKELYIGVNGTARKVKKAYVGDENGKARLWWGEAGTGGDGDYPMLAYSLTWYKTDILKETITTISIVNAYTPTGNEDESWAADVGSTGAITCYRIGTDIIIAGNGSGKIYANPDSSKAFSYGFNSTFYSSLTAINGLQYLDTSKVYDMESMFAGCEALTSLDLTGFDTSNVVSMRWMLSNCDSVTSFDLTSFNTSKVIDMEYMFAYSKSLKEVFVSRDKWDVSNAITKDMFYGCPATCKITYV